MLEAGIHNIFGSTGAGTHETTTFRPGAVTYERPADGTPHYRREVLGTNTPTAYVLLEEITQPGLMPEAVIIDPATQEQDIPIQRSRDTPKAAARIGLNAQLVATM